VESKSEQQVEDELIELIASCTGDPYKFVLSAFDWGAEGLEDYKDGPDEWQKEILISVRDRMIGLEEAIKTAVASGHGIGKSALVAWLMLWALSTFEDTRGVVTANTENQLKQKTWAELQKWYQLFIAKHWFTYTATAIFSSDKAHEKTWRIDMVPWSENKTEAFAGLHNKGKRIIIIFDEASAIPDKIWEVTEGAMTDEKTQIFWFAFGNPTRNTGSFYECFNRFRHRWLNKQIDSRTARMTNKEEIKKWIEDYGEDSDFVRVRVRGVFPRASDKQYIASDIVEAARGRAINPLSYDFAPKIITVDNAWTGGDEIVIAMRQGLFFKILAVFQKNDDDFKMAGHVARHEDEQKADAVLIDLGYGTGLVSAGKQMKRNWMLIPFGGASPDPGFLNLRAYMWSQMKKWLKDGGCIPDDAVLCTDLVGPEGYVVQTGKDAGKVFLESKKDMKKRGLASPNRADSLAISFAVQVMSKQEEFWERAKANVEYDPLKEIEQVKPSSGKTVTPYDPFI
jgi:hypothetical protein